MAMVLGITIAVMIIMEVQKNLSTSDEAYDKLNSIQNGIAVFFLLELMLIASVTIFY